MGAAPLTGKAAHTLTVCACPWSKRVLFEEQWLTLEEYLHDLRVSHGISPEAFRQLEK